MSRRAAPKCVYCGVPLDSHSMLPRQSWCKRGDCARRGVARARTERRAKIEAEARSLHPADASDGVGIVPAFDGKLRPLPADRRDDFLAHLQRVVTDAFAATEDDEGNHGASSERSAETRPFESSAALVSTACSLCRGYCCRQGGDTAFLAFETIARYREQHPDATAESVIEDYASRVPEHTGEGSCVFHGREGCALPRSIRSAVCNNFHCDGLRDLAVRVGRAPTGHAILVSVAGEVVRRSDRLRLADYESSE